MTKPTVTFRYLANAPKNNTEQESPTEDSLPAPQTRTIRSGSENHFIICCMVLNYIPE